MSFFSATTKQKPNIWDTPDPLDGYATPPFAGQRPGMGGSHGMGGYEMSPYPDPSMAGTPQAKAPGFFDKGGGWKDALGSFVGNFGDQVAASQGGPAVYNQGQQAKRAAAQATEAYNRQRQDEQNTWDQRHRVTREEDLADAAALAAQPQYEYFDDNAGNRWRMNKRTGETDAAPAFVDKAQKQFLQDGQLINVPNPYNNGGQAQQGQHVASGPSPGTVIDGHRFKGGDPNSQSNWEPVTPATPQAVAPQASADEQLPPGIVAGSPQAKIWLEARRRGASFIPRFSPLSGVK